MTDSTGKKKTYVRPVIRRQQMGSANKYGAHVVSEAMPTIDGISVEELARRFGSPLYIFSEAKLRKKIRDFNQAFSSRYSNFQPAWSYKTNYLNAICEIFHEEGSWAEVVSAFEYEKARANGVEGRRIIFNGPCKPLKTLKKAVEEGAHIHADHSDELKDLIEISKELKKEVRVALRVNLDAGMYPSWSRFGFNLESGHALEAARLVAASEYLRLEGIHCHIGTFILETGPYQRAADKMSQFYKVLRDELRQPMTYIDLGGGFASANKLKSQFMNTTVSVPSFDEYAAAICDTLHEHFSSSALPELFLEAGRALVDEAGYLLTTLVATKTLANGRRGIVLDAGLNLLYTGSWYDFKMIPVRDYNGTWEEVSIFGPLCMNIDVLRDNCLLPNMQRFDHLLVYPVGAYNVTQAMSFIELQPAVVLLCENGQARLIRKAQSTPEINQRETGLE